MKTLPSLLLCACCAVSAYAADSAAPAPSVSATDIAARLSALQQDGAAFIRMRMEAQPPGAAKIALQLQIKQRRSRGVTEVVYQVLWPKERAGEAVLVRKSAGQAAHGSVFIPPNTVRNLDSSQMKEALFGSDLAYADVVENFYAWEKQTLVGTEVVDRVSCQIIESKPGKGDSSIYSSVRSWVDAKRMVPMRVEKYSGGALARRIDTTRIASDDEHHTIPANLTVQGKAGGVTELEGSRIKHGVTFADREFTPAGLSETTPPRSGD